MSPFALKIVSVAIEVMFWTMCVCAVFSLIDFVISIVKTKREGR